MVIAFDTGAETLQSFTADQVALKNAINSIQPTDRSTKLGAGLRAGGRVDGIQSRPVAQQCADRPDVYLFSDGRASDAGDVGLQGQLHFERVGTDTAQNVAIVALLGQAELRAADAGSGFRPAAELRHRAGRSPGAVERGQPGGRSDRCNAAERLSLPDRWTKDDHDKWEARMAGSPATR